MHQTFILVTQEAEKLGAKHGLMDAVPVFEQKKREYFFFFFFGRRKKKKNIFRFFK